ncbi:hypothetical protein CVT25_008230 [Psilocybe cyanescens]|uniref:Uncharacterized protein n=1 Tax=Psilocybe cyanescens TaxID=93625 RepID=A0A409X9W2_PSICY|nr:hypothetical protein CVT25_008230 [Psilocybe cyanescens]
MPRGPKAAKVESRPERLDNDYLRTLTRPQIQSLAKNHGIKANQKTEVIITEILAKQEAKDQRITPPERLEVTNETFVDAPKASPELREPEIPPKEPVAANGQYMELCVAQCILTDNIRLVIVPSRLVSAPTQKIPSRRTKRPVPDQSSSEAGAVKRARRGGTPAQQLQSNQNAEIESQDRPIASEEPVALQDPPIPAKTTPIANEETPNDGPQIPSGEGQSANVEQTSNQTAPAPDISTSRIPPTVKDVRDVRKVLATLIEDRKKMQSELEETRSTLSYAMDTLDQGTKFVKEMSFRRQLYERDVVDEIKNGRDLTPKDRSPNKWSELIKKNWDDDDW